MPRSLAPYIAILHATERRNFSRDQTFIYAEHIKLPSSKRHPVEPMRFPKTVLLDIESLMTVSVTGGINWCLFETWDVRSPSPPPLLCLEPPAEAGAPLAAIDDRFPAVFELRRLFYPKFQGLADSNFVDQGIAGFRDHIQKPNFAAFVHNAEALTGNHLIQVERVGDDSIELQLDDRLIADVDNIVVVSFDSLRTAQVVAEREVEAIGRFLDNPDHLILHHDIGETAEAGGQDRERQQIAEHFHHGDPGIPPRQGFSGFARRLLGSLGVPVENRFGSG